MIRGAMLKREDNRVWLDLDEYYPPSFKHPNTVFKSLAIAFRAMGSEVGYVELMGTSAAAFRLQVGANLCPSSPHPYLGFPCAELAKEALGYELHGYDWKPGDPAKLKTAREAVVASIDAGRPALTEEEETGLAVGYVDGGRDLLVRGPYSNKGDEPELLGDRPVWTMTVVAGPPQGAARAAAIKSLQVAIDLAGTEEILGNGYASGFAAYRRWVAVLRNPGLIEEAGAGLEALVLGNAHIYYCLIDARRCGASYLKSIAHMLGSEAGDHLTGAAELYSEIAQRLDTGWANVPWPRQLTAAKDWTQDHRHNQAALLDEVCEMERQAVDELRRASSLPRA